VTAGSLFAGIGGFDLGLQRAGFDIRWQVEIDPFCRQVLARHFPEAKRYEDVRTVYGMADAEGDGRGTRRARGSACEGPRLFDGAQWDATGCLESVAVVCGGFPCQPFSHAGKRIGSADNRNLWPEFARIIRQIRPRWVVVENVPGLLSIESGWVFGTILGDLAALGYDAEWDCISAADVGAPHLRQRIWIVAYPHTNGSGSLFRTGDGEPAEGLDVASGHDVAGLCAAVADTNKPGLQGRERESVCECPGEWSAGSGRASMEYPKVFGLGSGLCATEPGGQRRGRSGNADWWGVEPDVGRVAYGIPRRVDRLRGLGNAIVPQIAEWIGNRIQDAERGRT
jgi:DNA (cytosine-5)-methyltransferase 1